MRRLPLFALVLTFPATAAVAQTQDRAPVELSSSSKMTQDKGESWTYTKPGVNLSTYRSIVIEPTVVYDGPDAQFGDIPKADRQRFAGIITEKLRAEVGEVLPVVARAGAGTARLRMTFLGMTETKGGVATATRVMPIGLATSALKSIAGKPGTMTGSMLLAVELFDGGSGELQIAAVRRRAPDALDIPATLSNTETVEAIAREVAKEVRKRLERGR